MISEARLYNATLLLLPPAPPPPPRPPSWNSAIRCEEAPTGSDEVLVDKNCGPRPQPQPDSQLTASRSLKPWERSILRAPPSGLVGSSQLTFRGAKKPSLLIPVDKRYVSKINVCFSHYALECFVLQVLNRSLALTIGTC